MAALNRWVISIYRLSSETTVVYENVKHAWWDGAGNYIVAQYTYPDSQDEVASKAHHYWVWPRDRIDHIKEERA